jgi:tryptophan halogenase
LFESNARVVRENNEMFRECSWAAVMLGQGMDPRGYHPFVDNLSDKQLHALMAEVRTNVSRIVDASTSHQDFLARF